MGTPGISKYVVKQKIGEIGGYLAVFAAHQPGLDRDVEMRVLQAIVDEDSEVYAKFQAECRALANLDHPGILKILDLGHSEKRVFYVTDPPPGVPLRETLTQGPLPADVVLEVGVQLGQALEHLHSRGLVHRGLSPRGIHYDLVTGRVVICDFSLLKGATSEVPSLRDLVDTDAFEALPERAAGGPFDARSDVFLAGAVLYAMLTGADPLAPANLTRIVGYQFPAPGNKNPDCPPDLDKVVLKAMAADPAMRHPTATEFVRDLENARRRLVVRKASRTIPTLAAAALQAQLASQKAAAEEAPAPAAAPPREPPGWFNDLKERLQPSTEANSPGIPSSAVLAGGTLLIVCIAILKVAFMSDRPPEEPTKPAVTSRRSGTRRSGAGSGATRVAYQPSIVVTAPAKPRPPDDSAAAPAEGASETAEPPKERLVSTPVLPATDDTGATVAPPADIRALVDEAREKPTTQRSFNVRWEVLRSWSEQAAATRPGRPPPFSPIDLTAVRLKVYRDPKEACSDLDSMLSRVDEYLRK